MTHAERAVIEHALAPSPSAPSLSWAPHASEHFVRMLTPGGCPLLTRDADGKSACSIWEHRPTTCRTFLCGRVEGERYEGEPAIPELGMTGCKNLSDRLGQSLRFLEFYKSHVRRQRGWALEHGYTREDVAL